jgi:hypothetical protein
MRFGWIFAVCSVYSFLFDLTVPYWLAGVPGHGSRRWTCHARDYADVGVMLLDRDEHSPDTGLTQAGVRLLGRDGQPGPWPAARMVVSGSCPRSPAGKVSGRPDNT